MDRYQRVEKPREDTPISANEIRITTQGRMRSYITYATSLLQEKSSDEIVFKAMGRAINKTVMIVELIKRRIVDLHEITAIGSTDITDTWEPLEEGLLPLETTRHVSMITITLSKKELDTSSVGYQSPLPKDQVKPLAEFDHEGGNGALPVDEGWDNRGRGYGRGGWGRGRGRGFQGRGRGGYGGRFDYQQETGDYNDAAPNPIQGRGRGGYGGRFDYQQETGDYNDAAPNPIQGRGRGRGRGPTRGRGRGFRANGQIHAANGEAQVE